MEKMFSCFNFFFHYIVEKVSIPKQGKVTCDITDHSFSILVCTQNFPTN